MYGNDILGTKGNFINIQHGHGIATIGARAPTVRTGYESVLAHRNSDIFAASAKHPGKVISLRKEGIIVEYDNGEQIGVKLGRRFGKSGALTYPFDIVTELKLGDKVKEGAIIAYNTAFFEPDYLNPGNVIWKSAVPITVALLEAPDTYEDSSAITKAAATQLSSYVTEVRDIVVKFNEVVHDLVELGKDVKPSDHLCIIEDGLFAQEDTTRSKLSASSVDTLRLKEMDTPRAKVEGRVDDIEVIYNGELADMTPSLRLIAERGDKRRAAISRAVGDPVIPGKIKTAYRVGRQVLVPNTALIRVRITHLVPYSNGDKGVFGNQLKTVNGDILDTPNITESGVEIHGRFGALAVGSRIVWSPMDIGTTARLLSRLGEMAVDTYHGKPVTL